MRHGRFSAGWSRRPNTQLWRVSGLLLGFLSVFVPLGQLAAQGAGGTSSGEVPSAECCLVLLAPVGARMVALGQALVARPGGDAHIVNPAALAGMSADHFVVHAANSEVIRATTFSAAIRSEIAGSFALTYRLFDHGDQDATAPDGTVTGSLSALDHVLSATYATRILDGLYGGVSYKLYQFRQDCRGFCGEPNFAATTHSIDTGLQYAVPRLPLRLGVAALHLGFPLQVVNAEQADPLPTRVRVGAAYEVLHHFRSDSTVTLWLSMDAMQTVRYERETVLHVGAEAGWEDAIFVRAGYAGGVGLTGAALGFGARYDRFEISVARAISQSQIVEDPFQFSFAIRF